MKRRTILSTMVGGISAGLAGCSDVTNSTGGNSLPDYHTAIPAETLGNDPPGFVYLDWNRVLELSTFEGDAETPTPTETSSNPNPASNLLAGPLVGSLFTVVFAIGFGLIPYGDLATKVSDDMDIEEFEASPDESPISSALYLREALVIDGDFDTGEYSDTLPDSFAEIESRDGYTTYANSESDGVPTVAISSNRLIFGLNSSDSPFTGDEAVMQVLDAISGEVERLADRDDDTDWTLRNGGNNSFVIGGVGGGSSGDNGEYDPAAGPLQDITSVVAVAGASVEATGDGLAGASTEYALFHTEDPVKQSDVEDGYSESDADVSVSVSDGEGEDTQRVKVSAEFTDPRIETPDQ